MNDDFDFAIPEFLNRKNPAVVALVEEGRKRRAAATKNDTPKSVFKSTSKPDPWENKPREDVKPVKYGPKATVKVTAGKKSDAEMIVMIKEHRASAATAGKLLKHLRGLGISCSQERFKKLFLAAGK